MIGRAERRLGFTGVGLLGLVLAVAAACAGGSQVGPPPGGDVEPEPIQGAYDERLTTANNGFAFRLLQELRQQEPAENLFFSPFSVSVALAMTWNGAGGETREAMAETLGFGDMERNEVNAAFRDLLDQLNSPEGEMALRVANSLWPNVEVREDFMARVLGAFDAEVYPIDVHDSAGSAELINAWVEEHTEGKIDGIVEAEDIHPGLVMILINAIYFLGSWEFPFDPDNTAPAPFFRPDGTETEVPMMRQHARMHHLEGDGFQALRMRYHGGPVSMYVFLPDEDLGLEAFLNGLDAERWEEWMDGFQDAAGELRMPRFEMEYEKSLNEALMDMGMGIAFGPGADFSPMSPSNPFIDEVRHKAIVEVHEEGTEAAAVTAVFMVESAPARTFEFVVDRPFFFALRDDDTGTVLFMGAVHELGE